MIPIYHRLNHFVVLSTIFLMSGVITRTAGETGLSITCNQGSVFECTCFQTAHTTAADEEAICCYSKLPSQVVDLSIVMLIPDMNTSTFESRLEIDLRQLVENATFEYCMTHLQDCGFSSSLDLRESDLQVVFVHLEEDLDLSGITFPEKDASRSHLAIALSIRFNQMLPNRKRRSVERSTSGSSHDTHRVLNEMVLATRNRKKRSNNIHYPIPEVLRLSLENLESSISSRLQVAYFTVLDASASVDILTRMPDYCGEVNRKTLTIRDKLGYAFAALLLALMVISCFASAVKTISHCRAVKARNKLRREERSKLKKKKEQSSIGQSELDALDNKSISRLAGQFVNATFHSDKEFLNGSIPLSTTRSGKTEVKYVKSESPRRKTHERSHNRRFTRNGSTGTTESNSTLPRVDSESQVVIMPEDETAPKKNQDNVAKDKAKVTDCNGISNIIEVNSEVNEGNHSTRSGDLYSEPQVDMPNHKIEKPRKLSNTSDGSISNRRMKRFARPNSRVSPISSRENDNVSASEQTGYFSQLSLSEASTEFSLDRADHDPGMDTGGIKDATQSINEVTREQESTGSDSHDTAKISMQAASEQLSYDGHEDAEAGSEINQAYEWEEGELV